MTSIQLFNTKRSLEELQKEALQGGDRSIDVSLDTSIKKKKYRYTPYKSQAKKHGPESSLGNRMFSELVSEGLRIITEHWRQNKKLDDETLVEILLSHYRVALEAELGTTFMISDYERGTEGLKANDPRLWSHARTQCENASRSAREKWNPAVPEKISADARRNGRKGGLANRKGTLDAYILTYGMTNAEAATALGVHPRTIQRMRQTYGHMNPSTGEIEDATTEEETPQSKPTEPDSVRDRVGDSAGDTGEPLAIHDTRRSDRQNLGADSAKGIREELAELILPF